MHNAKWFLWVHALCWWWASWSLTCAFTKPWLILFTAPSCSFFCLCRWLEKKLAETNPGLESARLAFNPQSLPRLPLRWSLPSSLAPWILRWTICATSNLVWYYRHTDGAHLIAKKISARLWCLACFTGFFREGMSPFLLIVGVSVAVILFSALLIPNQWYLYMAAFSCCWFVDRLWEEEIQARGGAHGRCVGYHGHHWKCGLRGNASGPITKTVWKLW